MLVRFVFWLRNELDRWLERHVPHRSECGESSCDYCGNRCSHCSRVVAL